MAAIIFSRLSSYLSRFENRILVALGFKCPSDFALNWNMVPSSDESGKSLTENGSKSVLDSILGDGFVFAVPKFRRSAEVRMQRKMAKIYKPNKTIAVCNLCGHYHQAHTICGNCYSKVREETEAIQEAIKSKWKLDPIDKEVSIVYQNENSSNEFGTGKLMVEMQKKRPAWFSESLMTKENSNSRSTTTNIKTINTEIKPIKIK